MAKKKATKAEPKKTVTRKKVAGSNSAALTPEQAAKIQKTRGGMKGTSGIEVRKAPKKVPEPKTKTGKGFLPGNRKALRKEKRQEEKRIKEESLTDSQRKKRTADRERKRRRSANAKKAAGKSKINANTGTRPSATSTKKRATKKGAKGKVVAPKTTKKSSSAKGKQKNVPSRKRK
jgi:hypothetical protein